MQISVVIPVLNESPVIERTLKPLQAWRNRGHKVIVVDGGSTDDTLSIAQPLCDLMLSSTAGRALQMNSGAEQADSDILLFLHADTLIDEHADSLILEAVSNGYHWGRFNVGFDSEQIIFRVIALLMNLRSCLTSIATGDQAIFVETSVFEEVGRYPAILLMEDIELSIRLKRICRALCLQKKVVTSARRWKNRGVIRTILLMWSLRLAYFLGVSSETLNKIYYR